MFECIPMSGAAAVTSLAVSSASSGELFAYDVEERQVVQRWQMRNEGTPLIGVPETYGVIYLTCCRDGDIYGVIRRDVLKLDVNTGRVHYLDPRTITDLLPDRRR